MPSQEKSHFLTQLSAFKNIPYISISPYKRYFIILTSHFLQVVESRSPPNNNVGTNLRLGQSDVPFANGVITQSTQALKLAGLDLGDPCKVYAQERVRNKRKIYYKIYKT